MWKCVPHVPIWVVRALAFHFLDREGSYWLTGLLVKLVGFWTKLTLAGFCGGAFVVVHWDGYLDDEAFLVATYQTPTCAKGFDDVLTCFHVCSAADYRIWHVHAYCDAFALAVFGTVNADLLDGAVD
jgi:hypothetical protein